MSPQRLRAPMLIFAAKKLSTGANGQKEDAAYFFCPHSFDRAVWAAGAGNLKLDSKLFASRVATPLHTPTKFENYTVSQAILVTVMGNT